MAQYQETLQDLEQQRLLESRSDDHQERAPAMYGQSRTAQGLIVLKECPQPVALFQDQFKTCWSKFLWFWRIVDVSKILRQTPKIRTKWMVMLDNN